MYLHGRVTPANSMSLQNIISREFARISNVEGVEFPSYEHSTNGSIVGPARWVHSTIAFDFGYDEGIKA